MPRARKGERSRATSVRIVGAARARFGEHGYLETTMAAIAAGAGVAVQTLYLSFGSKVAILERVHDQAVVGDDEPIPVLERAWVDEVRAQPDGRLALETVLLNVRRINERVSPIYEVIQAAAADSEVAALLNRIQAQRLTTMRSLAEHLATKPGFTRSHSADWAADVLYATASIELLGLVVAQRRWSVDDFDRWTYDIAAAQLFPTPPGSVRSDPLP